MLKFGGSVPKREGQLKGFLTDRYTESGGRRGLNRAVGLECILSIVRALRMGSCLSAESRSPIPGSPTSPAKHHRSKNSSKRRNCSRNSSFGDLSLHRIPGRLFTNGFTDMASLFTQQGKKGTNQDAMIVWEVCSSFSKLIYFS